MCARMKRARSIATVQKEFKLVKVDLDTVSICTTRITPNTVVPIVRAVGIAHIMEVMKFGYTVNWMDRPLINARAETVLEKPMFYKDIRIRRCIIPIESFSEKDNNGRYHDFQSESKDLIALGGIYNENNEFAILTTNSSELVKTVHQRMPVIVPKVLWNSWLDEFVNDKHYNNDLINNVSYPFQKLIEVR